MWLSVIGFTSLRNRQEPAFAHARRPFPGTTNMVEVVPTPPKRLTKYNKGRACTLPALRGRCRTTGAIMVVAARAINSGAARALGGGARAMTRVSLAGAIAAVAAAALALTAALLIALDERAAPPIIVEDPLVDATIVVAVGGAVASPGVYPLRAGARLGDLLAAAGGPAPDADLAAVNPARRLRDEDHLVIPRRGSPPAVAVGPSLPAVTPGSASAAADAPAPPAAARQLDLNVASVQELDGLPGIGPALAERIVAHRERNGPFRALEELARISGISPRMVEELRPLARVGG